MYIIKIEKKGIIALKKYFRSKFSTSGLTEKLYFFPIREKTRNKMINFLILLL